jgi:EAL domain-containing protein (putative c-di-GMP-specific phosphodiesterase class I)
VEGFPLSLDASFGVAVLPDHAHDSDTLWQRADEAMGQAKRTSHHIAVCGRIAPQDEHSVGRLGLLADLNRAPLDRQLFLEYQPQIDLITGEIMGVEALVRWHHPTAGTLYPAQFVGLAEQTDLIQRVTETVLRQAVIQCVQWAGDGRRPLRVGVNVSARNLQDLQFPGVVREVLRRSGVDPALIDLEITENTFGSNREITVQVLGELRQLGLAISIDDFGTGYSSMSQLRELPISQIKIDRSFVTHMVDNARDRLIVHGILQLAQSLHIETIAEGIEDPQVAAVLRELGCDIAQGWLYGKPMSPELIHR